MKRGNREIFLVSDRQVLPGNCTVMRVKYWEEKGLNKPDTTSVLLFSFTPTWKSKGTNMLPHWEVNFILEKSILLIIFISDSDDIFVTLEMWNGSYYFDKSRLPKSWQQVFSYQRETANGH